jgi:hypothetical protein
VIAALIVAAVYLGLGFYFGRIAHPASVTWRTVLMLLWPWAIAAELYAYTHGGQWPRWGPPQ